MYTSSAVVESIVNEPSLWIMFFQSEPLKLATSTESVIVVLILVPSLRPIAV